nr:RNA-directed DNA polymerase, eukaryota [Tanacetum cinerariifolium]
MNHLFFACSLARDIYRKIALWWELTYSEFHSYEEWLAWFCSLRISSKHKELLEWIYYAMWWQGVFGSRVYIDHEVSDIDHKVSDMEMIKKRFSKLLLGEDMSGVAKVFAHLQLSQMPSLIFVKPHTSFF